MCIRDRGYLVLRAPGMLRMDIPLDVIEDDDSVRYSMKVGEQVIDVVDEGELAAAWISNFVQVPCRIMKAVSYTHLDVYKRQR